MTNVSFGNGVTATDIQTATAIAQSLGYVPLNQPVVQTSSPTTGQTVTMTDNDKDGTLYITPSGSLVALSIVFPSNTNSRVGQIRRIACTQAVTALTLSGGTILNTITTLVANDCFSYQKVASNTWVQI